MMSIEKAILAGGCFWGVQELIRALNGVTDSRVGYTGGDVDNATYSNHGTHAEAVEVTFDSEIVSFRKILTVFFQMHDPTTVNKQGNDEGLSYRSAIFCTSNTQKKIAEKAILDIDHSGLWPGKVVTTISKSGAFWEAESEHQDYLQRIPSGYTCHFLRNDWILLE